MQGRSRQCAAAEAATELGPPSHLMIQQHYYGRRRPQHNNYAYHLFNTNTTVVQQPSGKCTRRLKREQILTNKRIFTRIFRQNNGSPRIAEVFDCAAADANVNLLVLLPSLTVSERDTTKKFSAGHGRPTTVSGRKQAPGGSHGAVFEFK